MLIIAEKIKNFCGNPHYVFIGFSVIMIAFGLALATPIEIYTGLKTIVYSPDILITDYIEIGGLGAALVNSGLVMLLSVLLLMGFKHTPTRFTVTTLLLAGGFAFFGKNPVNILPIILGGFLFSLYAKEPFHNNVLATLLGTTLSPAVSQMTFLNIEGKRGGLIGIIAAIVLGCTIGFIIEPLAKSSIKSHEGYNLYNVGFAAGILGVIIMSVFRNFGFDFTPVRILSSGNDVILAIFLCTLSLYFIIIGVILAGSLKKCRLFITDNRKSSGGDYFLKMGAGEYLRMGLMGLFVTGFVWLTGTDINGPIIGGIFTIVGFSCSGKKISNIVPVMFGASIAGYLNIYEPDSTVVIMAVLFSTCLCPIAEEYGWVWGTVAGMLHMAVSLNVGIVNGGLNLYNNGLAGGFVAMTLVPIIKAFNKYKVRIE